MKLADKKVEIMNKFSKDFKYRRNGQWVRSVDGYEDEDGNFVSNSHEAYAVPEFLEQFIDQALDEYARIVEKQVREEYENGKNK